MLFTNVHNALDEVAWTNIEQMSKFLTFESTSSPVFFYFGEFSQPGNKKKGLGNPTKGFLRFFKKSPYLDEKNLEVARFRQCVHVGRQN